MKKIIPILLLAVMANAAMEVFDYGFRINFDSSEDRDYAILKSVIGNGWCDYPVMVSFVKEKTGKINEMVITCSYKTDVHTSYIWHIEDSKKYKIDNYRVMVDEEEGQFRPMIMDMYKKFKHLADSTKAKYTSY